MAGPYPDTMIWAGPGGQIGCPACTYKKENRCLEVWGNTVLLEVAGWEPEIQRLQQLLEFYHKFPTIEEIDSYIKDKARLRSWKIPDERVIRQREIILSLFDKIKNHSSLSTMNEKP